MKSVDENQLGMVHVYTGSGPGKTRSAFGIAMRALGHGYRVYIIQFMKGRWRGAEEFGEIKTAKKLEKLQVARFGTGEFIGKGEKPEEIDKKLAAEGLKQARDLMNKGDYDLLILDEVNMALHFGLIELDEILSLIEDKPEHMELILTGRKAKKEIRDKADYLITYNAEKHPYQKGIKARKGIEY